MLYLILKKKTKKNGGLISNYHMKKIRKLRFQALALPLLTLKHHNLCLFAVEI